MAFVDEIQFHARAGKGGDGVVRWRHEKFINRGGPSGGNGGRGGDVYIRGVRSMHTLAQYRHEKEFAAHDGNPGEKASRQGKEGDDLYIALPLGSIVRNLTTGEIYSLLEEGETHLILRGGKGGWGNEHFKSSINTSPKEATLGVVGEEADFSVSLELVADIGLVGLPNAGKSSLLNALTNAQAKIGDYAFTTIDPNLGDFYGYIIADIPGLIEGASQGKGLGTKFLRHIKRTKMLVHLVPCDTLPTMKNNYVTIRKELESYGEGLSEKQEIILLTKTDMLTETEVKNAIKEFEVYNKPVFCVSLFDDASIKKFADSLIKIVRK